MSPPGNDPLLEAAIGHIGRWILVLALAGTVLLLLRDQAPVALSFAAGGTLAYFAYRLHVLIIDRVLRPRPARGLKTKVFLASGLIILAVYAMIRLLKFEVAGFIAGLLLPAGAVVAESILLLLKLRRKT